MIVAPLVLVIVALVAGGLVLRRAETTLDSIRSVSTPPPVVTLQLDNSTRNPTDGGRADGPTEAGGTSDAARQPLAIDTQPARDVMAAAGIEVEQESSVLGGIRDRASNVGDFADGAVAAAGWQDDDAMPALNILVMGVDARPGEEIDIGVRPDALAVLHLDPESGSCRLLGIPRDSRVELPGYGLTKINHALAVGGIPYQQMVVEQFLGLTIDRYALIDFTGVASLVDAVGGVTVMVTESFTSVGITFKTGRQTLDGAEALAYSRYRGGPDGDFGRIRRQQQVLRAALSKASGLDAVKLVGTLLPLVRDHFRTNFDPAEIVALASRFRRSCTEETIRIETIPGTIATYDDPILHLPLSYVIVDPTEVRRKVNALLGGS